MATFVLVPPGWSGTRRYRGVAADLRRRGHQVHPVPLTGVGELADRCSATVNLDTHIRDVTTLIQAQDLTDVVLVGHSYAGMVITGAADALPGRIRRLVYSDAYVPEDGQSCWELTSDRFREVFASGAGGDGCCVVPPPGAHPEATAHPIGTFLQRIRLHGRHEQVRRRDYIFLSGWDATPFAAVHERLRQDPGWQVHTLPTTHDVLGQDPDGWVRILLDGEDGGRRG